MPSPRAILHVDGDAPPLLVAPLPRLLLRPAWPGGLGVTHPGATPVRVILLTEGHRGAEALRTTADAEAARSGTTAEVYTLLSAGIWRVALKIPGGPVVVEEAPEGTSVRLYY